MGSKTQTQEGAVMADELKAGDVVYVTKYALTQGIQTRRVKQVSPSGMIQVYLQAGERGFLFFSPRECHATTDAALARAREMKRKRLISLCKQVDKLRAMTFTIPDLEEA